MINMVYRVDKRVYKIDDIIYPQGTFEKEFEGDKLRMETMLHQKRAHGIPERSKCLFLFHELHGALRFYSKYGGNIYGVVARHPIYFRGDMNKLDNILDLFKFVDEEDKDGVLDAAVNTYWKGGTHTFNPCYEILVGSAKVIELLCDDSRHQQFKEELHEFGSIEKTILYKELIQIVWERQESQASASHGSGHWELRK